MLDAMIYKPYDDTNIVVHLYRNVERILVECNVDVTNLDAELHKGETFRDLCAKLGIENPSLQIVTRNETRGINEVTISYSRLNHELMYATFASHIMDSLRSIYVDGKFKVVDCVTTLDLKAQRVFWAADREAAVLHGDNLCYLRRLIENSIVENSGVKIVSVTGSTVSLTYRW